MDSSLKELSSYRLLRAKEMLAASEENLKMGQLRTSLNRSYYAVFHAMRAVNILEGFDSSKYSGVIAFFNKNILKENKMDRDLSGIIKSTSYLREKSDYDDFYIASKNEAEEQLTNARLFLQKVEQYLKDMNVI